VCTGWHGYAQPFSPAIVPSDRVVSLFHCTCTWVVLEQSMQGHFLAFVSSSEMVRACVQATSHCGFHTTSDTFQPNSTPDPLGHIMLEILYNSKQCGFVGDSLFISGNLYTIHMSKWNAIFSHSVVSSWMPWNQTFLFLLQNSTGKIWESIRVAPLVLPKPQNCSHEKKNSKFEPVS
jgi:hypothetical protein